MVFVCLVAFAASAHADEPKLPEVDPLTQPQPAENAPQKPKSSDIIRRDITAPRKPALRYRLAVDIPITAVAASTWLLIDVFRKQLAPEDCRWCQSENGMPRINGVDNAVSDALRWEDQGKADNLSALTGYVLTPALTLGMNSLVGYADGARGQLAIDGMVIVESVAISAMTTSLTKITFGRERPYAARLPEAEKPLVLGAADNNLSFYSGHTSFTFSLAVASGTVATMRGYKYAPLVWISGLGMATTTGYLRIAADRHFFTDVLVGAVMGSAIGFSVPYFFHRGKRRTSAPSPSVTFDRRSGSALASATFTF